METVIPYEWRRHIYVTSKISRENAPACSQGFTLYGQKHLPFSAESHSTVVNSNTGLLLLKTLYWTFTESKSKVRCKGLYKSSLSKQQTISFHSHVLKSLNTIFSFNKQLGAYLKF